MIHPRKRHQGEQGVAVILTALCLIPLMAFAAFGVDLASWYSRVSFLQKSADAASLAGTVWMPDLGKATTIACDSLQQNGIDGGDCGSGDFGVDIDRGATSTSLRVTVTDPHATRYFSQVITGGDQVLTRSAEAEYNLPIPLGSPLNYFGGDSARTAGDPVTTYSVSWPTDYTTRAPANVSGGCNVGTSSGQNLGRWPNASGHTSGYDSGDPQCQWTVVGAPASGTSASPPPDYTTRQPNNSGGSGCRVRRNGNTTPTLGRWQGSSFTTSTSGTGGLPTCSWTNFATNVSSIPAFAGVQTPTNRPCRVGYEASGPGGGWWPSSGGFDSTANTPPVGGSTAQGNRLCSWTASITTNTVTPPNPIDSTRSPGFWAAIEGPQTRAYQGDAYSTRCYDNSDCSSDQNEMYLPTSDPDRGFWYVVKIPAGLSGQVAINVFDGSYVSGNLLDGAGDRSLDGGGNFTTAFRVHRQTNPLDFSQRTPVTSGSANTTDGSCNWSLNQEGSFKDTWRNLCNLTVSPGQIYLINVQTPGTTGAGVNGYALEAVAAGGHAVSPQPALYAYGSMAMQNNNFCEPAGSCTPPPGTFYLAEVGPQYAGRTLVMELWDSGDVGSGVTATMAPMKPSTSLAVPRPVVNVPDEDCTYTADADPNDRLGVTGPEITTPHASDSGTICQITTSSSGTSRFNGEWLRIRIAIPSDYTCTLGVNPETTGGSCWWGIRYTFTGSANDVTTWQARIEGNPVHLTQ